MCNVFLSSDHMKYIYVPIHIFIYVYMYIYIRHMKYMYEIHICNVFLSSDTTAAAEEMKSPFLAN
jgi:hypothetical protein